MRFLNIVAEPHPSGNRIDLRWVHPDPTNFPGVRIVRRERTHPRSPMVPIPLTPLPLASDIIAEGDVIADTSPAPGQHRILRLADDNYAVSDTGLKSETVYYYTLFPYTGNPPDYQFDPSKFDPRNRVSAMATARYDSAGQMADLLPTLYQRYDTVLTNAEGVTPEDRQKGQLRRFLDLPGSQLDLLYSFARGLRDLHDVEKVDSRLLALLAQWIGWRIDQRIEADTQRNNIRNAPHLYQTIGTIPTVEATVKRVVGWKSRSKEFVHNVFRSNQPERLNLWVREQNSNGKWSTPTEPLSLDFAYEGRPAAVHDKNGTLWLFYHTLRKGHWNIWYKTRPKGKDWTPSEPLTNRAAIDKYPTAALQGETLWVFWSTYSETTQRWEMNFRTLSKGQWSPITPARHMVSFVTDQIQSRQPWLVQANDEKLWLFWLELLDQQWQLRYARRDNNVNSLFSFPFTFPIENDGNPQTATAPRVESAPFVLLNTADTAQPLWVFWARNEIDASSGQRRWRIVYRVKANLEPNIIGWSAVRALPPGSLESDDREPAAVVNTNGDIELYWRSNRGGNWSIWRATLNHSDHSWGQAELLPNMNPWTSCDPLPIDRRKVDPTNSGLILVYRSNQSVTYKSDVYKATTTTDNRYAGSTTVVANNKGKKDLRGEFEDFQTYTYDTRRNGKESGVGWYARETVGLFASPGTDNQEKIQSKQALLRTALPEFLPAAVRPVFITVANGADMSHTILEEGKDLPARSGLNFVGAGVTASDEAEQNRTTIIIRGSDMLNVKDFGAKGDGVTNDADAIIAAMARGVATNTTVYIPAGDYFTGSTVLITPDTANGSLRIHGAGKGITRITRTNGVPATTFEINFTGPQAHVWIADLSILGPLGINPHGTKIHCAISWVLQNSGEWFRVERVEVTGTHDGAVARSGRGTMEVIDCDLAATDTAVSCFESTNTADSAFFYARGGTWQTPNGDLSTKGSVGLYIHPHIPYLISGVTFQNMGRYGIYQNGSLEVPRKPAVAVGCRFINAEMVKTEGNGVSIFEGCAVAGSASGLGSGLGGTVLVSGCSFERTKLGTGATVDANVTITNSRFTDAQVIVSGADRHLQIRSSTFVITDAYPFGGHILQATSGDVDIDDVLFHDQTTTGVYTSCLGITKTGNNPTATVRSNRLRSLGPIRADAKFIFSNGATSVTLDNSDFHGDIYFQEQDFLEHTWAGSNNFFHAGRITGTVEPQQRFVRRVGVNPQLVASAPTLDVGTANFLSYDTHVITGSAAIKFLDKGFPCVGILRLVVGPGGAWSLTNDGHIMPKTTDPRTPGTVVTLLWEPITGKWLEV